MWPIPPEIADLVTFTEEIFNRKLHFSCSVLCKIGFLKNFTTLTRKTHALESDFNKVAGLWHRCLPVFSCESREFSCDYFEIFKNIYFEEHLRMTASEKHLKGWDFWRLINPFHRNDPFLYHWEHQKNKVFLIFFRGYRNRTGIWAEAS